jgi:hypothetical protein
VQHWLLISTEAASALEGGVRRHHNEIPPLQTARGQGDDAAA